MLKNKKSGFTLIELLVVIAIIGILSSVVLASLNTARAKGSDATIKSDLAGIQTQAAIYYDSNSNSYDPGAVASSTALSECTQTTTLFADPNVTAAVNGIQTQSPPSGTVLCSVSPTGFAIQSGLKSTSGTWCVDSSGNATSTTIQLDGLCI